MIKTIKIGDIAIRLKSVDPCHGLHLPASFAPFLCENGETEAAAELFVNYSSAIEPPRFSGVAIPKLVASGVNDLGEAKLIFDGRDYIVALLPHPTAGVRYMKIDEDFRKAEMTLLKDDPFALFTVDSMLRIYFSQVAALNSSFLLHASAVEGEGKAHLFMGKSGTGKSTHSRLWLQEFEDFTLLNDDNPLVRICRDGVVRVSGTPWSGKTPCYRNRSLPLGSLTRLYQAKENKYRELKDTDAFVAILPGVSVFSHSRRLYDSVCDTITSVAAKVRVGTLGCLPHPSAAIFCRSNVVEKEK